ncbi:MAG: thioredoxin [Candidatus Dojkabacteria bacterium]|nr:thioredoxin [Candidatus Dojkabacteria bacterium]MDQ7020269.1 thioredoxin [Candidatus Dojkabacteria bacterium]
MSDDSKLVKLSSADFDSAISEGYTFVDFWAEWCGPCRMIAPVFEDLSEKWDGKIKFAKLNVDENPEVADTYGVQGIPTLILYKDGEIVKRLVGAVPEAAMHEFLNDFYDEGE